jgi:hypothetical protein
VCPPTVVLEPPDGAVGEAVVGDVVPGDVGDVVPGEVGEVVPGDVVCPGDVGEVGAPVAKIGGGENGSRPKKTPPGGALGVEVGVPLTLGPVVGPPGDPVASGGSSSSPPPSWPTNNSPTKSTAAMMPPTLMVRRSRSVSGI